MVFLVCLATHGDHPRRHPPERTQRGDERNAARPRGPCVCVSESVRVSFQREDSSPPPWQPDVPVPVVHTSVVPAVLTDGVCLEEEEEEEEGEAASYH